LLKYCKNTSFRAGVGMKLKKILIVVLILSLFYLAGCGNKDADKAPETENTDAANLESSLPKQDQQDMQNMQDMEDTLVTVPETVVPAEEDPPRPVTVLSSLPGMIAADSVDITGKTKPGKRIFIDGQEVVPEKNGTFTFPYNLQVGENKIKVVTLGKEEIEDTQTITIERRPIPPLLTVIAPDSSDSEYLVITGQTEKECVVYVNNTPAKPDRKGCFTATIQLKEGQNSITVSSTNKEGGTATTQKTVSFAPTEPRLEVIIPEDSKNNQVSISGITDTGSTLVYINDVMANINPQSGVFSGTITLEDGVNTVTVTAINKWGKTNSVSKNIFYFAP